MFIMPVLPLLILALVAPGGANPMAQSVGRATVIAHWAYANANENCASHLQVTYSYLNAPTALHWRLGVNLQDPKLSSVQQAASTEYLDQGSGPVNKSTTLTVLNSAVTGASAGLEKVTPSTYAPVVSPLSSVTNMKRPCRNTYMHMAPH